jgi:molybdate transport system ATP-binding protein
VELRGLRLTLGGQAALRGVSWTVRRGEGWLVTGPNGSGKTSLLRVLAGRAWPDPGKRGGVRRYFFEERPTSSPIGLAGRVAWLSPETHRRFARLDAPLTAGDAILTGFAGTFLLTERPTAAQRAKARRVAETLGLASGWRRPFAELSQGRQRLVLLARALAPEPELLVLDEFSDGLDDDARARGAAAIQQRLRAGATAIVATHRADDALPGLTLRLAMNRGRARLSRARGIPSKFARATPRLKKMPPVNDSLDEDAPTLRLASVSVAVGDHRRVRRILHGIHWIVRPGEHWAVLGANGSGKSTLLRAIYGDLPAARGGTLERFGCDARKLPLPEARRRMGWVSPALQQHYAADASVAEVVASGFQASVGLQRRPTRKEIAAARAALRALGVGRLAARRWEALSFGEARLALLARALAHRPCLLLLDEPCDGLAPAARVRFLRAVERAAQAGTQVVVAAHRAEDLPTCVNRVLRLKDGRVCA